MANQTDLVKQNLQDQITTPRATVEAKDAELDAFKAVAVANERRADAAEARVKELEDLLNRSYKAARLEDLRRIAALERELATAKDMAVSAIGELAEAKKDTARLASVAFLIRGILASVKGAEHFTDKTADVRTWSTDDVHEFLGALKYELGVAFRSIKDIEVRAAIDKAKEK